MNKKGFTLIEMIAVISIVTIIGLIATPSVGTYMGTSEQINRTEIAKTIYLTAQNQFTQLRALGHLKSAYSEEITGIYFEKDVDGNYTDELDVTKTSDNNVFEALGEPNYPVADLENGKENYVRYLSKPAGDLPDSPIHKLLEPAIRDQRILEGAILIEYNILTGKILSVFYSDDENAPEFSYVAKDDSDIDIFGERAELYNTVAIERNQGYFGVDYTGSAPPDLTYQMAIHLYDGYEDGHDDTVILPGITRYNKPLDSVNNRNEGAKLENILYAEIFVDKEILTKTPAATFSLSISAFGEEIVDDLILANYTDTAETLEMAIEHYDFGARKAIIYRNDSMTGDPDFARFIWVIDLVGGDMSSENADRNKYSITSIEDKDGDKADFSDVTTITASISENSNPSALTATSNEKHPLFADKDEIANPDPTLTNSNIASARHISNIRYSSGIDNEKHTFNQIKDINFASDDGSLKIAGDFADTVTGSADAWNLKMSPLPKLSAVYSGLYEKSTATGTQTGAYSIQNLNIFDVNKDTNISTDTTGAVNHSVGLFEKIGETGEVAHLVFIEPTLEIKDTESSSGTGKDDAVFAGVVTGLSNGSIHHVTVISSSETSPIIDQDSADNTNITDDYVGGIVGMVGSAAATDSIHHVLYLAVSPSEQMGSAGDMTRYDYPIVGTNLTAGLTLDQIEAEFAGTSGSGYANKAIDNDSCYYLIGKLLRPYDDDPDSNAATPAPDHDFVNVDTVTDGFGKGISTNDLYANIGNPISDFYNNFMMSQDGSIQEYNFVQGIADPLDADQNNISSLQYPYPYYGDFITNNDAIDPNDTDENLNFVWPVAELENYKAEFIYYEVYGDVSNPTDPKIGLYQLDASGNPIDRLEGGYRVLSDGYAIRINRPYSMIDPQDLLFKVNDVTVVEDDIEKWFIDYTENERYDEFTDKFRLDPSVNEISSILTIDNKMFSESVREPKYGETTDVVFLEISDGLNSSYLNINPLFAKAIYLKDATDSSAMTYSVRSARHLNNIGGYTTTGYTSPSIKSTFNQERDIDLANFGGNVDGDPVMWAYSTCDPAITYFELKHDNLTTTVGSGLVVNGSVVGASGIPFAGSYNGNGYTVKNYHESSKSHIALFQTTASSATIKNLKIDNFILTAQAPAVGATLVATNMGTVENITVTNSIVTADKTLKPSTGGSGAVMLYDYPTNVGGVVATNTGIIDSVTINSSAVSRTEVYSTTANPLYCGIGGVVGNNAGTVKNSGVLNTTITAYDNFIGGVVGMLTAGTVQDNFFIYNGEDAAKNPIVPIGYDTTATLIGTDPRYSIGGIVGGASGASMTIQDNLYLALAPTADTDGDNTDDMSYPLVGSSWTGSTLSNNIYLKGTNYSTNNIDWTLFNYNMLPFDSTIDASGLVGLPTENINRDWLSMFSNNQLANWTAGGVYPIPPSNITLVATPYASYNRPKQHTAFAGNGIVEQTDNFKARLLFGGSTVGFALPTDTVTVALELTNTSIEDLAVNNLTALSLTIGSYADYLDVSAFSSGTAVITLTMPDGTTANVPYTFDSTANAISLDTSGLANILTSNQAATFGFNLPVRDVVVSSTPAVSTDFYYAAMRVALTLERGGISTPVSFDSDKLYIQPATTLAYQYNGGTTPVPNTGASLTFSVTATITTSNKAGFAQKANITETIPSGFTVVDGSLSLSVDGTNVALTSGTNYTLTSNADGTTELKILNVEPTGSVELNYTLSYTGGGGTFNSATRYNSYNYNTSDKTTIVGFEIKGENTIEVEVFVAPPAPAPASLEDDAGQNQSSATGETGDGSTGTTGDGSTGATGDGSTGTTGDGSTGTTGDGSTGTTGDGSTGTTGDGSTGTTGDGSTGG